MLEASSRIRFSIRFLLGLVTLASVLAAFFSFERTAERLPRTNGDPDSLAETFRSDAVIRALVKSIPEHERPRLLRGGNPDYEWLKQNLSTSISPATREITVSISARWATSVQLRRLLDSFSRIKVVSVMEKQSASARWSRFLSDTFSDVHSKITTVIPGSGDTADQVHSQATGDQRRHGD